MAKARLLRQYLTDYNREVQGANKDYEERYNHYKAAVEAYNAHAAPTATGGGDSFLGYGRGILQDDGKVYSERNSDGSWSGKFWSQPARELTWDEAVAIGEQQRAAAAADPYGMWMFADPLPGKRPEAGSFQASDYETWAPIGSDDPRYAQKLAEAQAAWDKEKGLHEAGGLMFYENAANYRINREGGIETYGLPAGTFASAYRAPANAPTQETPKAPTFTVNQLEELANPSNSAAEINRAQAFGYTGKSALVAERDPTKNSAFANLGGDDPNQLKDRGVLARAIAGEL